MTTPSTPDLGARILAAIDNAERAAHYVLSDYAGHEPSWTVPSTGVVQLGDDLLSTGDGPVAEHIALNDPQTVLWRCAAERGLVKRHSPEDRAEGRVPGFCVHCGWRWPCPDVRELAEVYGVTAEEQESRLR